MHLISYVIVLLCVTSYFWQIPGPCETYSAVDGAGMDLSAVSLNATNPMYAPPAPYPPGLFPKAQCRSGPCVNTCCAGAPGTGFCTDNLVTQGGFYNPSEFWRVSP